MQQKQHHGKPQSRVRKIPINHKRAARMPQKPVRPQMISFTVRPFDPLRDADRVGRYHAELVLLQNELWRKLSASAFDAQETRRQMQGRFEMQNWVRQLSGIVSRREGAVLMLETPNQEPAGYVFVTETLDPITFERVGIIGEVFMEEPWRGRTGGSQALAAAEKWLQTRGIQAYQVFVTKTNVSAVDLYQKNGYAVYDYRMVKRAGSI